MDLRVLLLAVCSYCTISSGDVNITDNETLKQYLCLKGTLPFNTRLILSKSKFLLHPDSEGGLYCLVENTTDLSILPSHEILSSSDSANYVTIACNTQDTGIGFFNVTNLNISSIVFEGCMGSGGIPAAAVRYINESSNYVRYSENVVTSLLFNHCCNLRLHNTLVVQPQTGIPGFHIIGVNLCGESIIEMLLPTAYSENVTEYPSLTMLIYFTDSNLTSTLSKCDLSITSNIVHYGYQSVPFVASDSMWIRTPLRDFTFFTTQQHFDVFVNLNIGHHNKKMQYPTGVLIGFINSITSSRINFQGYNLQYLFCAAEDNPVLPSLQLLVVFYETSSFMNKTEDVLSPLVIKNTSFSQHFSLPNSDGLGNSGFAILQIIKFTGKLSHEIVFHDVAWCKNDLAEYYVHSMKFYYMYAFHAQNKFQTMSSQYGHLYLNFTNVIMHHNTFSADESLHRNTHVLMSFNNVQGVTMTGTSYFADNGGGTAINIESSNLTVSGNLTVKDGLANEGGGIHINEASTLFLKEPLRAYFCNNTAIKGSAIYAPVRGHYHDNKISVIQILPDKKYSLHNVTLIRISMHFEGNGNGHISRSLYAPHLSFFGKQTSPNFSFKPDTWDHSQSQYAYTTLIDTIFHMEERDKYTSFSNGLCVQFNGQQWKCHYIDLSVVNSSIHMQPQCENKMLYSQSIFPGQQAFSLLNDDDNQFYDIGYCYPNYTTDYFSFEVYKYWNFSIQNYTQYFTFLYNPMNGTFDVYPENAFLVVLYSDIDTNALSVPILQLNMTPPRYCPIGFNLTNASVCHCESKLAHHGYRCDINTLTFTAPHRYWTGFHEPWYGIPIPQILIDANCPPNYCKNTLQNFQLDITLAELSCLNNRTGILCGDCKENYSVVFGSDVCFNHCTDVYLLTLPVYALAGLLLVLLLFVLRLTVATGTVNGLIFYANMLGLVMDKIMDHSNSHYLKFVYIFISLLNLDLGFPLCLYSGMTTAGKVGFQFVFPVYLWSIVVCLIVVSKFSTRFSKVVSSVSVQVLATLFYLSFSKLLRTVILILGHSSVQVINFSGHVWYDVEHVWYYNGKEYGHGTHALLLALAVTFTLFFLLPYALLVTFSSCLMRFRVVNRFKPFIDAYGGPFKDKWRFWFGLRLWVTILLFGLDGAFEGVDSNLIFTMHIFAIIIFIIVQDFARPFKNSFVGFLDTYFMLNYWFSVELYLVANDSLFTGSYIFLTITAMLAVCFIVLFHIFTYRDGCNTCCQRKKHGYKFIKSGEESDSDADLFMAAEERVLETR